MANIHRLGDYNNQNRERRNGLMEGLNQPIVADQIKFAEEHRVLFASGRKQVKDPAQETYWDMLTYALCPTFKFLSLTFIICLADIAVFVFEVAVGLDRQGNLLQVNVDTLITYGGNLPIKVQDGEVYRLISAMFLHVYFMHILGNLVTTFMFLSRIEYSFGFVKTLIIYLVSGICGNIFSLVCNPSNDTVRAGASTALYGIIGVIFGYIVINWQGLDSLGQAMKCQIWCTAAMIIFFIFAFTPSGNIDFYGHLGGFIAGVWLSAIHKPIVSTQRENIIRVVFAILLLAQIVTCFLVFYLAL